LARTRARRQQAAKQADLREQRRNRQEAKKRLRRWAYLVVSAVIGVLIIISLFLPSTLGNRATPATSGPGESFPILPAEHIPNTQTYDNYNSVPPTSGPHWETEAPWGISATAIPNERQVHNLEHGGVVIQYNTTDTDLISKLEDFAKRQTNYPCYLLVAPYPSMSFPVAMTAWGYRAILETYDEARLQAFVDAYKNQGPEKVACTP